MDIIDGITMFLFIIWLFCWVMKMLFLGKTVAAVMRRPPPEPEREVERQAEAVIRRVRRYK